MKKTLLFAVFCSISICAFAKHRNAHKNINTELRVAPTVTTNPNNTEVCVGETATFTANGTGADTFIWQINVGAGWTDLSDDTTYAGVTSTTLTITNPVFSMDQYDYRLRLSNMDGSVETIPANLKVEELPDASISVTDATCDISTGAITFTFSDNDTRSNIEFSINGGNGYPYNYLDTTSPQTVSNLSAGTYNVWVRWGNNECPVDLGDYIIGAETSPTAIFDSSTDTSCGLNNGSLSFALLDIPSRTEISFSTNNGSTYDYTFNDSSGTGTISDLAAGDYDIWVSYNGDCPTSLGQYTVNSDGSSAATATVQTIDATTGNLDGRLIMSFSDDATQTAIEFSIDGGTNYDYSFDDTIGSDEISSLAANTYNIWVRHGDGSCASDLGNFTINEIEYTTIPDSNFESVLNNLGYDNYLGDNKVPTALIEVVTTLTAQFLDIYDFTGVEDFVALESLTISYNSFTDLDVSNNVNLTFLNCGYSTLTSLDVSNNVLLETLWVNSTSISALDLSQNTSLTSLTASGMNNLTTLNMRNGNNANVANFTTIASANLSCITVDDVAYSTTNWTNIDVGVNFSISNYCGAYTAVPDLDFELYLEILGYDDISSDGQVPTELIETITDVDISGRSIADLTGLEDFTALTSLACGDTNITTLDLSSNVLLETLDCNDTALTTLNVAANTALINLKINDTGITTIDVSANTLLETLDISGTTFTTLNVANNTALTSLTCFESGLTALDVTTNIALTELICYGNSLTVLDVSNNTLLDELTCRNNNITALDLSSNTNLTKLFATSNALTVLDVSNNTLLQQLFCNDNNITEMDVSNNPALLFFNIDDNALTALSVDNGTNSTTLGFFTAKNNPDLTCILVDDATYSTTNWINIDGTASFSDTYCRYTAIPDTNFEAALEALGYDDISGDGQVPTALIESVTSLSVSGNSILDLTGIENFVALTVLTIGNNNDLATVDLSNNPLLTTLNAYNCEFASIDLSVNTALEILNIHDNPLTTIDVSANTVLTHLGLGDTSITSINIQNNPLLKYLDVTNTNITSLDLTNNPLLEELEADNIGLTTLDVSNNTNLLILFVNDNQLTTLDLSNNILIEEIYISNNNLSDLNIQNGNNANISAFNATSNANLTCILVDDIANTSNLTNIDAGASFSDTYCRYTAIPDANFEAALEALGYDDITGDGQVPTALIEVIADLNVNSQNIIDITGIEDIIALKKLWIKGNSITTVDLSIHPQLTSFRAEGNDLISLDVTNNLLLTDLRVQSTGLTEIDLSNNPLITILQINSNELTELDLTVNTLLTRIRVYSNKLTSLDLSNQAVAEQIQVDYNELTYLNVKNGNNGIISTFEANNNNDLTCILVDDAAYSTTNWTTIDAGVTFSTTYCRYTAIPDANFEAELEALGYDDISADGQVPTALIETVTTLNLFEKSIADLTGIEDFAALTSLDARGNDLINLDVSNNTLLETLLCQDNVVLASLNVSNNALLDTLVCDGNQLATLDISSCIALEDINISDNPITTVNTDTNIVLNVFAADNTSLEVLDFSNNPALVEIEVTNSNLRSLNVQNGNNTNISDFYTTGNSALNCILVDDTTYSTTNWTDIDMQTSFSDTGCLDYTYVPDDNFEAALGLLGYDDVSNDNFVPTASIIAITSLNVRDDNIANLTGIEDFQALTFLNCSKNQLTSIDVSSNTALETLFTGENLLTSIDVTNNTNLTYLDISENTISTLDVSNNTALTILDASDNSLTTLDVTALTSLESLYISDNAITAINVTNSTPLKNFGADNCALLSFDASGLANLETITIQSNLDFETLNITGATSLTNLVVRFGKLAAADVSTNPNLELIFIDGNELTSFDMTNNPLVTLLLVGDNDLQTLDLRNGNIETLATFQSSGNALLTCINVDNPAYATANFTSIDAHTSFGINECGVYAYVPDDNFEAALGVLGYDDISDDNQIPLVNIDMLTTLDVSGEGIIDLTGIKEFIALTTLNVSGNAIVNADFSTNPLISTLNIANNQLVQLDLTTNTALTSVDVSQNALTALNIQNGMNTSITNFDATTNPNLECILVDSAAYSSTNWMMNIDMQTVFNETDCTQYTAIPDANFEAALEALGYDNISGDGQVPTLNINTITSLNVASENIADLTGIEDFLALTALDCSLNVLTTINVSNNVNLLDLDADENLFMSIDISNNTLLQYLDLDNCMLNSIDLSANTQLVDVDLQGNFLTSIDLSNNLVLEVIDLETNDLTSLDVANNILIEELDIEDNEIATLMLPTSTSLVDLDATNNMLTSIDVSSYINLEILDLDENQLETIDVSQNIALTRFKANDNNLISLSLNNGNNTILATFDATNNVDLYCILVDDEADSTTNFTNKDAQAAYNETSCDFVIVDVDVFLQGALIDPNTGEENLMRDDLRIAGGLYSSDTPYGDGATMSESVGLSDAGANSTVDWIWVELRDANSSTTVVAGQSGILQRDGDIVATNDDLVTPLTFENVPAGDYFIVIKHRNHLGIMTASALTLSQATTTVDFTDANNEITFGSNAQTTFGMPTDVVAMWCGNANEDSIIQYSGVNPDTPDILSTVLNDAGNFLNFPTYVVSGYNSNDVNMDGNTQYSGTDPDVPFILQNVLAHPNNFLGFSTFLIIEQLPEVE